MVFEFYSNICQDRNYVYIDIIIRKIMSDLIKYGTNVMNFPFLPFKYKWIICLSFRNRSHRLTNVSRCFLRTVRTIKNCLYYKLVIDLHCLSCGYCGHFTTYLYFLEHCFNTTIQFNTMHIFAKLFLVLNNGVHNIE